MKENTDIDLKEEENLIRPSHYGNGECNDILFNQLGHVGILQFYRGNIIKYVYRHEQKMGAEDLRKAYTYACMGKRYTDAMYNAGVRILTGTPDNITYEGKNECIDTFREYVFHGTRETYYDLFNDLVHIMKLWLSKL